MKPGDVLTCTGCRRHSEPLHDRGGRPWPAGALIATWGPAKHTAPEHETGPTLCAYCQEPVERMKLFCAAASMASLEQPGEHVAPGFEVVAPPAPAPPPRGQMVLL